MMANTSEVPCDDPILAMLIENGIPITLENYVDASGLQMEDMEAERMSMLPLCLKEFTPEFEASVQEAMQTNGWNRYQAVEAISRWRVPEEL